VFFCLAVTILAWARHSPWRLRGPGNPRRAVYRTLLIWPYAIAPAVSAVLWLFILNPQVGLLGRWLERAQTYRGTTT